jgi:hypothetical protein
MSDALFELIAMVRAEKRGDTEFLLHCTDGEWRAEVGNPNPHVPLGESVGDFRGLGETAEGAVAALLSKVRAANA